MASVNSNKRLAKNTILLYFRMVFLMLITLYTSRVTLDVLGVDDFGIYNIVGGVVVLFAFLSRALTSACNRFFSVAVGKNDVNEIQKTFSTALVAHLALMLIVVSLLETIGLWYVINKLNVPEGRETATYIIYQLAILSTCFNILRIPYNSSIIANERMDFYAYTSVAEGILKLVICWVLLIIPIDKLVSYSLLMLVTIVFINICFWKYCTSIFQGNRFLLKSDTFYMKEMLSFSGWNLFTGVADIGWQQGTNLVLNLFYGVSLNATMGITNQIRTAVYSFVSNLQTAANPQIIKTYAVGETKRFYYLVNSISKFSYILMLLFTIPLVINMDFILHLWLKEVPTYSVVFATLILIFSLTDSISGPLWISVQAKGNIKTFSVIYSIILLLNVPITYILFAKEYVPETMLYARIVINIFAVIWELLYVRRNNGLSLYGYAQDVFMPILVVTILSCSFSFWVAQYYEGWLKLIVTSFVSSVSIISVTFLFGMKKHEKEAILNYIKLKLV